jgi:hypothetical protein
MALWQTAPGASPWRGCCSKEGFSPAPAARDAYVEVSSLSQEVCNSGGGARGGLPHQVGTFSPESHSVNEDAVARMAGEI